MITYENALEMLDEIAAEFPEEFYADLNGGVLLLNETMYHEESGKNYDLFILGQYHHDPRGLGRYISIYYGSFRRLYGRLPAHKQRAELKRILAHEFTHHIESLAGDRSLIIKDAIKMNEYKYRTQVYDNDADAESGGRQKIIRRDRRARRNE